MINFVVLKSVFNSDLLRNVLCILGEFGESELAMFKSSIVEAAVEKFCLSSLQPKVCLAVLTTSGTIQG